MFLSICSCANTCTLILSSSFFFSDLFYPDMFIRNQIPSQLCAMLGQTSQGLLVLTLQMILYSFRVLTLFLCTCSGLSLPFLTAGEQKNILLSAISHTNSDFCCKSEPPACLGLALLLLSTFVSLTGRSFPFSKTHPDVIHPEAREQQWGIGAGIQEFHRLLNTILFNTLLGNRRSLVYMKNKLSNNRTELKYQEGNGTILNIMV